VALVLLGLVQAALGGGAMLDVASAWRAGAFLAYAAVMVWAMGRFGFVWVAPPAMLALMLLLGERRLAWLGLGALAVPALVWTCVVVLLGRTLPG
jgi:putative tricarboxylic transport membrane protein